jgi:hypothetical protein
MKLQPFAVAALGLAACGPPSQIQAVSEGASHACNYYQRCGQIGPGAGEAYDTEANCTYALQGQLNTYWPPAQCTNHISGSAFNACMAAMDNTACNNAIDLLNTVLDKCSAPTVCSG